MSTFYTQWYRSAQSGSTVKLIRNGKVFADSSPDAYTGSWNATLSQYEFTLDTATFVDATTYRIEDGSGNIVVKDFPIHPPVLDDSAVPDNYVKNDQDDSIIGELTVKPASGTDSQLRVGNESGSSIRLTAENAAASAARTLEIKATGISLMAQDGSTAIKISNMANGTSSGDAINKSQLDAVTGGSSTTISALDTRVTTLEGGSGTFTTPDVNLAGVESEGGIGLNWGMNSSGNESAVLRYEVYVGNEPIAGYSAGVVTSGILDNIKAFYRRLNLATPRDRSAFIPCNRPLYCIVVAFDHTATPVMEGSANTQYSPDNGVDPATKIIGGSKDVITGLETLAAEVDKISTALAGSAPPIVLFNQSSVRSAGGGSDAAALTEWTETTGSGYKIIRGYLDKNSIYKKIQVTISAKISSGSGITVQADCSTVSVSQSFTSSSYVRVTFSVDLTTLADGGYEFSVTLKGNGTGTATATGLTVLLLSN